MTVADLESGRRWKGDCGWHSFTVQHNLLCGGAKGCHPLLILGHLENLHHQLTNMTNMTNMPA